MCKKILFCFGRSVVGAETSFSQVEETAREREERLKKWEEYLTGDDEQKKESTEDVTAPNTADSKD